MPTHYNQVNNGVLLARGMRYTEHDRICIPVPVQGKIAHFKIPEHIRFVDTFPTTVTGKIQKFKIRQQEIEERGLRVCSKPRPHNRGLCPL